MNRKIVVIGAGMGGLSAAALLARAGLDVTVLEAHVYAGGCAGTFFHGGYRFDAGATLAAGFEPGGGMARLGEALGVTWPVEPAEIAMQVHLPNVRLPAGQQVTRWSDPQRWREERLAAFGAEAEPFWRWQEAAADRLWQVALSGVAWPPQGPREAGSLARAGLGVVAAGPLAAPGLGLDALRSVGAHLRGAPDALRQYVDGQLLIAAQATSERANALYGAAALDMPRRGVAHVRGGIGKLAETLVAAIRAAGGQVLFRQRVTSVERTAGGEYRVFTQRKGDFAADEVIFNLPPWDAAGLMGGDAPARLRGVRRPADGWGAFMVYAGLDERIVPEGGLHHQVLLREPLGEGNSVFLSLSLAGDAARAPEGQRALTISTHTDLRPWWELFERDRPAYEARKAEYTERVLAAAEVALPGLRSAARLVLPGTPVTFQRYTSRSLGWVGGFPQTSLFRAWAPRLGDGLWLAGDSIFPGQSILATALGGARVAKTLLAGIRGFRDRRSAHAGARTSSPDPRIAARTSWYNNTDFHKGGAE